MAAAEPWRKFLDEEIQEFEKGSVDEDATIVIRDVLAANSTSELLFKEAALRLDKHDKSPYLTYDPMDIIVYAARLIPFDDEKQDRLIQLLKELMKLCQPGSDYENGLSGILEKRWNGLFPTSRSPIDDEASLAAFRQKCDEWRNFSAFKARTLAAGICAHYPDWSFKAPNKDVHIGLGFRKDIRGGGVLFTKCTFMVAVQYILIAGEPIKIQFEESEALDEIGNQAVWKLWAERFREVSTMEGIEEEMKSGGKRAHDKMVALWPELFADSSVPVPDAAETTEMESSGPQK